ncbi:MAG: Ku protein [Acidimicrobiaceae bacterium]|nr:Ku protein [Acidimicrobiaceae bacterium]
MPRAIWSGSISFGLVNIPVRLFTAVRRKTVRFNQIDSSTGLRVKQRLVSAADGEEVPKERIVRGYPLDDGGYVTVSEEEMAALDPDMARTIDIDEFIDLSDIDPIFYDNAYFLVPGEQASKPYKLLVTAMEEAQKVGICHFVMRSKRYLAAVRPVDGRLLLSTMVYHDEIVDHGEIEGFEALDDVEIDEREQAMAQQLIAALDSTFDPTRHSDTYREAVLELIERKAAGERSDDLMAAPESSSDKVIDLMAALEASVNEAKKARKRHPAAGRKAGRSKAAGQAGQAEQIEQAEPAERTA